MNRALGLFLLVAAMAGFPSTGRTQQTIFFTELFDGTWTSWYDGTEGSVDNSVYSPYGGNSSVRFHWPQGATNADPQNSGARRRNFPASDTVYMTFDMKLGTANQPWQGSGLSFHPHIIYLLTDANAPGGGLASTYLTFYIEWSLFTPRLAIQDGQRINTSQLTNSSPGSLGTATPHAVAGGNGLQNQATPSGAGYYCAALCGTTPIYANGTNWDSASANLVNNTWHRVEVHVAMNSISGGVPQANGIIRFWVDGSLVVERTNVYLRTAQFATQKFNQLVLSPFIGNGSPIAQDMWIDNLVVADQRFTIPPPANLRVLP